jgi:hypothetical protein
MTHSITILWGSDPQEGDEPKTYTFATKAELDAFMTGVAEAEGWMGYREIEPGFRWDFTLNEQVVIHDCVFEEGEEHINVCTICCIEGPMP